MEAPQIHDRRSSRRATHHEPLYPSNKLARMGFSDSSIDSMRPPPQRPARLSLPDQTGAAKLTIPKSAPVLLWHGLSRTATPWDSLRRDPTLYDNSADCCVHFHAKGKSQRGPSMRVPRSIVTRSGCMAPLKTYSARLSGGNDSPTSATFDSGYSSGSSDDSQAHLFIPAPANVSGADALNWHLTTRNLFAWIMDRPLVGRSLGKAIIDLFDRLLITRPDIDANISDLLAYCERMGYATLSGSPEHALAMLALAEHADQETLWKNAFVHCVGMSSQLYRSPEYGIISRAAQSDITNSFIQMESKVDQVKKALHNFLEDDLAVPFLGLTPPQRAHLDRFRSCLNAYYVNKLGYWPPPCFDKMSIQSMYDEFKCLYDLLANSAATGALAVGGLCVMQNVGTFDRRHDYKQLTNPVPLIPASGHLTGRMMRSKGLSGVLKTKHARKAPLVEARSDLMRAMNTGYMLECGLVQAYIAFEQDSLFSLESGLSVADARKVRWIQIYYIFQTLRAVMKTSLGARTADSAEYFTCCNIPDFRPSAKSLLSPQLVHPAHRSSLDSKSATSDNSVVAPSIHPDCESDDYFTPKAILRRRDSYVATPLSVRSSHAPSSITGRPSSIVGRPSSIIGRTRSILSISSSTGRKLRRRSDSLPVTPMEHTSSDAPVYPATFLYDTDDEPAAPHTPSPRPRTPTLDFSALGLHDPDMPACFELEAVEAAHAAAEASMTLAIAELDGGGHWLPSPAPSESESGRSDSGADGASSATEASLRDRRGSRSDYSASERGGDDDGASFESFGAGGACASGLASAYVECCRR